MRQDFFEFEMSQKHVIVGNFKPRLKGGDPAMARRMLLVPFLASFKGAQRDPHMLDKLKAEAPAILHWLIGGAQAWAAEGLAVPESVRAASADYMADHDDLALWMDECCERQGEAKAADLYASFSAWKKARGEHASSMTAWGSRLTTIPGIEKRKASSMRYAGIRLTFAEMELLNASRR
jgi:putative DNA primase/helicase